MAAEAIRGLHDAGMLGAVTCLRNRQPSLHGAVSEVSEIPLLERHIPRRFATRLGIDSLMRQNYFGMRAALNLSHCGIVHGFTGQMTEAIKAARRRGMRTIVDRPNTHVAFLRRIMESEHARHRIPFAAYTPSQVRRESRELVECDAIVTCSQFAKQTMVDEGIDAAKIRVIPYGVDLDSFRPSPKPDSVFRVVFVGLICLRKGVQYLLDAWEHLRLPDSQLVLQGHVLDDAAGIVRHYRGRFDFTIRPHTDDAHELCRTYNSASVCVFPSLEDGFGMVVTEAMACDRPVIVTRVMGAADLVAGCNAGMVIPAGDAGAIAEAIRAFHENSGSCCGGSLAQGPAPTPRDHVAPFTWDAYRASLLRLYRELAGSPPRSAL